MLTLVVAACSGGGKATTTAKATATSAPGTTTPPVPTIPAGVQPTPVSGAYSVYVDPTYGYSFQYPATWIVQPAIGSGESNVVISEPQPVQTDPNYPTHPLTQLMVRATNDFSLTFVQHLLCNGSPGSGPKVANYATIDLTTYGGDPKNGYTAPAFGLAFFAKDKNLAFELWLQSDAKAGYDHNYINDFFRIDTPIWQHILPTFAAGSASKVANGC